MSRSTDEALEEPEGALTSARITGWVHELTRVNVDADGAELIDQISALERLKGACAAAQARLAVAFATTTTTAPGGDRPRSRRQDEEHRRRIASQIALARRESPHRGGRHVGLATALIHEMPRVHAALQRGQISEWRAILIARETACLSVEHRRQVDAELADQLPGLGDRAAAQAAARIAYRLDPEHFVARNRTAENDRRVSIRPAPDMMSYLTALLPVAQGVAVHAALTRHADTATSTGDPRSRGQLMADELVTRITQPSSATQPVGPTWADRIAAATAQAATQTTEPGGTANSSRIATSSRTAEATDVAEAEQTTATGNGSDPVQATVAENTVVAESTEVAQTTDAAETASTTTTSETDCADKAETAETTETTTTLAETDTAGAVAAGEPVRPGTTGTTQAGPTSDTTQTAEPAGTPGVAVADSVAARPPACPATLELQVLITDRALFDGDAEPAIISGYGAVPAALIRRLVLHADAKTKTWVRRLYTDPATGHLAGGDTHRRLFPHTARQFLISRDQTCRFPYCDAPIRHADHIQPFAAGGPTTLDNAQGYCVACNNTKTQTGWTTHTTTDGAGIITTTPTGHTTRSDPPPPPRSKPWADLSSFEHRLSVLVYNHDVA